MRFSVSNYVGNIALIAAGYGGGVVVFYLELIKPLPEIDRRFLVAG